LSRYGGPRRRAALATDSEGEQGIADKDWDSFVCMFFLDGGVAEYQLVVNKSAGCDRCDLQAFELRQGHVTRSASVR
jgi:hypothetical protein